MFMFTWTIKEKEPVSPLPETTPSSVVSVELVPTRFERAIISGKQPYRMYNRVHPNIALRHDIDDPGTASHSIQQGTLAEDVLTRGNGVTSSRLAISASARREGPVSTLR